MSGAHNQQSTPTWTEPPWSGWIETTGDALLILEAARRGLIPRVTRRLVDSERKMITSGSVFVFDEDESGIKRWTDGFFWSPSRILGNFLLYRETDKRGAGHRSARNDPDPNDGPDGTREVGSLSRPKSDSTVVDKHRERTLMGSLTNTYKFKPDGLMKKTFSLTIGGVAQHLISYYKIEDVENGRLRSPSSMPELASLDISPEYLDKTHFRNPPKVETGVDGVLRYRGEADDIDSSSPHIPTLTNTPLLSDVRVADGRRGRRAPYGPYHPPPARGRRARKPSGADPTSPTDIPVSPQDSTGPAVPQPAAATSPVHAASQPVPPQQPAYADPNATPAPMPGPPMAPPGYHPYGVPPYFPPYAAPALYHHHPQLAYAPPAPPVGANGSPPGVQQQQGTAPVSYAYPGYNPHGSDPSQAGQAAYYPYYGPPPPPHGHPHHPPPGPPPHVAAYHSYQAVPWGPYPPYPPQPQPMLPLAYSQPVGPAPAQQPLSAKSGSGEDSGEEA